MKNTVQSGQETLTHLAKIGSHAKSVIYNMKHATPRILRKKLPNQQEQTIIITPKVANFVEENILMQRK